MTIFVWPAFMNKYILMAAACLSFAVGWQVQGWRMGEKLAKSNLETAETLKSIAVTAANKQRDLQDELDIEQAKDAVVEAEQYALLRDAENKTRQLNADVNALRKRLLVNASCPARSDNMPETGSSTGLDNGIAPELNADARQDYYSLRDGIERVTKQLLACQSRLK